MSYYYFLRYFRWSALLVLLNCALTVGQPLRPAATVHLKFVSFRGDDLGIGIVTLFDDESSKRFAYRFGDNEARNIPYGTYHLQAHKLYFSQIDRTILVYQKDVWAVVQLNVDEENGSLHYRLQGRVTGWPSDEKHLWIRAQGLYSGMIADTQTTIDGQFEIAGLPSGTYILTTYHDTRTLDTRSILIPPKEQTNGVVVPVEIKLRP